MNTRSAQGPRFLKRRLQAARGRAARGGSLDVRMRSRCAPALELSAASAMSCPMFPVLTLLPHPSSHAQALDLLLPGTVAFLFTRTSAVRPSLLSLLLRRLHIRLLLSRHRLDISTSAAAIAMPSSPLLQCVPSLPCLHHVLLLPPSPPPRPDAIRSPLLAPFIPTASAYALLVQAVEPKPRRGAQLS